MQPGETTILVIEDEDVVREGLEEGLTMEGYKVEAVANGQLGLEAFDSCNPHLVILDLMMPEVDGLEVCKHIRAEKPSTPVIMLTAKSTEVDKIIGLELGADDYLTKPFSMRELFARVKALLRRVSGASSSQDSSKESNELSFGDVSIDFSGYRALKAGEEVSLSAKEFELLKYLSRRPDVAVSRNQLLDEVWGYNSYPTTRTVDNFIARLRNKLEDSPDKPQVIVTVHGVGYKFVFPESS